VVEERIAWHVDWRGEGAHELALQHKANRTTENGQPLPVPWEFFGGDLTVSAPDPWEVTWHYTEGLTLNRNGAESVQFVRDPLPVANGCAPGPASLDASELARSIQSDPDLVTTAPADVTVGGLAGLQIDVTVAPGASVCEAARLTQVVTWDGATNGNDGPQD
jgi:hypothetical protein